MCYNFNGLEPYRHNDANNQIKQWSVDEGYNPTVPLESYPLRTISAGIRFGFSMLLKLNKNELDYLCATNLGFKVNLQVAS
jgi:hypothetical protein